MPQKRVDYRKYVLIDAEELRRLREHHVTDYDQLKTEADKLYAMRNGALVDNRLKPEESIALFQDTHNRLLNVYSKIHNEDQSSSSKPISSSTDTQTTPAAPPQAADATHRQMDTQTDNAAAAPPTRHRSASPYHRARHQSPDQRIFQTPVVPQQPPPGDPPHQMQSTPLSTASASRSGAPDVSNVSTGMEDTGASRTLPLHSSSAAAATQVKKPKSKKKVESPAQFKKRHENSQRDLELFLQKHKQSISKDERGRLKLDGKVVVGSHYTDLMHSLFNGYTKEPKGLGALLEAMKKIKVPSRMIGNPTVRSQYGEGLLKLLANSKAHRRSLQPGIRRITSYGFLTKRLFPLR